MSPIAKYVLKDAGIKINSVDLSDHFSSVEINDEADDVEFTGFTSAGYREFGQGLKDATITLTAFNDEAASSVDATLYPFYVSGGTFPVRIRSSASSTIVHNMSGKLFSYSPIAGDVGDASTTDIEIRNGDPAGLTRGTVF